MRDRPRTRADCLPGGINEARPCPWVSCRHHLGIDFYNYGGGHIVKEHPGWDELDETGSAKNETCSLDVADSGSHTLYELGALYGVTRERVRQVEVIAL